MIVLFWFQSFVVWIDLDDEIFSIFKEHYDLWLSDSYLETDYVSVYPKDPFKDAMKDMESMSMQLKISWSEYIENELAKRNCSLSQKKIWSILYFFVPEFRAELARSLKIELGEYNSSKLVFDEDKIYKYCREYYYCEKNINGWDNLHEITSSTPANIFSNCKQFFTDNYKKWEDDEQRAQNTQISQLWADKFWNATTDDSPYDILTDFWTIWRLLYTEAEQPITPVFYNLPIFSNSKKKLENHKKNGSSYEIWWESGNKDESWGGNGSAGEENGNSWSSDNNENPWEWTQNPWDNGWWSSSPSVLPLSSSTAWFSMEGGYDRLVEWLWALSVVQDDSIFYWSLCNDDEDEPEPEPEPDYNQVPLEWVVLSSPSLPWRVFSKVSDKQLELVIGYMKAAVNWYVDVPEEKKEEMKDEIWDTNSYTDDTTPDELERTAKKIKNCWESCEWLRFDQYASCVLMCACWEIDSPIFDPEKTPWLWPIFMIKFCTVPGVDTRFSIWWRKMVSIQEWIKEIYWVVDKLSREWRLWIWTQQYNFLDASTKKMKVADSVAFSISMEFVDISNKPPKKSAQYNEKKIQSDNKEWQTNYLISNDLRNPVLKNTYRAVGDAGDAVSDFSAMSNADWAEETQTNLAVSPFARQDPSASSRSDRYANISQILDRRLDQQWNLWIEGLWYIEDLDKYAVSLYAKPKI